MTLLLSMFIVPLVPNFFANGFLTIHCTQPSVDDFNRALFCENVKAGLASR